VRSPVAEMRDVSRPGSTVRETVVVLTPTAERRLRIKAEIPPVTRMTSHHDKEEDKARLGALVLVLCLLCLLGLLGRLARCLPPSEPPMPKPRLVAVALLALCLSACGHGATACKVIDVAHEACSVVRYLGPDGKVHEVQVSSQELAAFGQTMATKRAQETR
jgi:hypothetical protein